MTTHNDPFTDRRLTQFVFSQSHNPRATSVSHISGLHVITRHTMSWDRRWNFIGFSEHDLTLTKVDMCVETIMLGALNFPWKRHQLFMLMQLALRLASSLHEPLLITTYKTVTVNFKASILSLRGWWAGHKLSWRWRRTRGKQLWKFHQSRPHTTAGPVSGRIVEEQRWVEGQTWGAARAEGGLSHPATALCDRANTHTLAIIVALGREPQRQSSACPTLLIYLKRALWSRPLPFISSRERVCVCVGDHYQL